MASAAIYDAVRTHYSSASRGTSDGKYENTVAQAFGYSPEELASIPQGSNLGLSCGNPIELANLKQGETVLDLGCGAGFDVFLSARKIGSSGLSIGVDMNRDMLAKAERNKSTLVDGGKNIKFVENEITKISGVDDNSVDCIMSNCVINLVPEDEKHKVFEEMYRILKPGGRVAVSDILLKKELSPELKQNTELYVGCISGASMVGGYEKYLTQAGFEGILVLDNKKDLNVYNAGEQSCCGVTVDDSGAQVSKCGGSKKSQPEQKLDLRTVDFNALAGSYNVFAVKKQ